MHRTMHPLVFGRKRHAQKIHNTVNTAPFTLTSKAIGEIAYILRALARKQHLDYSLATAACCFVCSLGSRDRECLFRGAQTRF